MEINIDNQMENVLLSRKEITGMLVFDKQTPSKKDVVSALAKKLGVDESLVVVKGVYNIFGNHQAQFIAHIYPSRDVLESIEPEHDYVDKAQRAQAKQPAADAK